MADSTRSDYDAVALAELLVEAREFVPEGLRERIDEQVDVVPPEFAAGARAVMDFLMAGGSADGASEHARLLWANPEQMLWRLWKGRGA